MTATATATAIRAVVGACQGCGGCLLTCPERAIRPVGLGPVAKRHAGASAGAGPTLVVLDTCTGCGDCVELCPVDAIELVELAGGAT
ncbi:4Fe-4S dicluster domain-containing protein [uncultured Jatrophihabitans sp.]|uniref:4Fe-4S dicluster domain-containing protein n=1 Tax=uncultured Jatrophihabitans sp. TaxID=1610747 RepID=UPI0035C9CBC2